MEHFWLGLINVSPHSRVCNEFSINTPLHGEVVLVGLFTKQDQTLLYSL